MELGTFGAIMSFALDLEQRAADYYEQAAPDAALFAELAKGTRKRLKRVERARREGVAEMILESITGLDSDDYAVELNTDADATTQTEQAKVLEESSAQFYRDAAAKMPIREIVRLFERLAKENDQRKAQLQQQ